MRGSTTQKRPGTRARSSPSPAPRSRSAALDARRPAPRHAAPPPPAAALPRCRCVLPCPRPLLLDPTRGCLTRTPLSSPQVSTDTGEEFTADAEDVMPMHPSSLSAVDDMVRLGDLNEAAILNNLRLRFRQDDIYTYIGPIQIACNPYKALPIFGSEQVARYHERGPTETLPPHIYELASNALRNMLDHKKNQSVVISGESGAGKTECTKLVLQFLAEVAGEDGGGKEQLLLESSPILEVRTPQPPPPPPPPQQPSRNLGGGGGRR